MRKSRGTGTYIPDMVYLFCAVFLANMTKWLSFAAVKTKWMTSHWILVLLKFLQRHNRYKDLLLWMTMSNPDSSHRPLLKSPQKTGYAEDSSKTVKRRNGNCLNISPDQISPGTEKSENGSCLNLSLDQYPLLPCSKKSLSSETHHSYHTTTKACQAKYCSATLGNIQFGSLPLLPGMPSSMAKKQANSGVSTSMDRMPAVPRIKMHKQQGFLESPEKMYGIFYYIKVLMVI